ncbi:MAG: septum formation initiator family protein [Ignavibacteria bacterium]|nr:septum formation initiator family protein [Ignavibacteria bacterium]
MAIFQINRKTFRLLLMLIFVLVSVYFLFFSKYGYLTRWRLEKEKKELLQLINSEIKKRDSLEKRINLLENDTLEIERIAREYYGLVKEGEEIYAITKKKAN